LKMTTVGFKKLACLKHWLVNFAEPNINSSMRMVIASLAGGEYRHRRCMVIISAWMI